MRVSKKVKIRTISVFLILVLIIRLIWPGLLVSIVKRIDPFSFVLFLLAIIIFYSIDIYEGLIKPHLKAAVRFLVFMMCLCLILLRFAKPDLKFDGITINLLIIAVIVIIIPDLIDLLLRIRKVKKGDFEAEFGEAVSNLVDKTIQAEDAAEINSPSNNSYSGISSEVAQRLAEAATDPRGAFLILSIEIESRIRLLGNQLKMGEKNRFMPISSILMTLNEQGFIDMELMSIYREFRKIRNVVSHGAHYDLDSGRFYELVDLGLRILRLLPTELGQE